MLMELEYIFMSVYKDKLIMIFFKMRNPKVNKIFCSYILMLVIFSTRKCTVLYLSHDFSLKKKNKPYIKENFKDLLNKINT